MRRLTLNAVVITLVVYALAGVFAAASAFWLPSGTLGLTAGYAGIVRAVTPGGPAAEAGIVAGDRIDLAAVPFEERRYVAGVGAQIPLGTVVHLKLLEENARDVVLEAIPNVMTGADRLSLLLECAASLIFIAVGATLILVRPNRATWGFGLYCLLILPTAAYPFRLTSAAWALAAIVFYDIVQNVGVVGLLVFALDFPRAFDVPWRRSLARSVPAIFVLLAAMTTYPDVANLVLGIGAEFENTVLQVVFGCVFGLSLYVLFDTYRRVPIDERERLRWVAIGFSLGLVTSYVGNTLLYASAISFDPPGWLSNVLLSLNVLLPLTVAHAVVRHRVFDINFVIGRALIYAALTTLLAGLFGLLDWLFGSTLEDFRLSRLIQAGISISIAFAFDSLHKRIERAVEAIFFRRRRAAEARLDRLIHELPQARSVKVVEEAVVGEVVDALELLSAALFVWSDSAKAFVRTASAGWEPADCTSLDETDLLVLSLRAQKHSIDLAELPWHHEALPQAGFAPLVAVPMYSRADLTGIILYGGHPGGADVDPAELSQLERLAHAASIAFDELEAEELRSANDLQSSTIGQLEARLDELRRLLPERTQTAG